MSALMDVPRHRAVGLGRMLGWFSLALGAVELLAGRSLAGWLGLSRHAGLIRAFGAREIAAGALVLARPRRPTGLWARFGGDVLDLALLGTALVPHNRRRPAAALATAAVIGVTALDLLAALRLRKRDEFWPEGDRLRAPRTPTM